MTLSSGTDVSVAGFVLGTVVVVFVCLTVGIVSVFAAAMVVPGVVCFSIVVLAIGVVVVGKDFRVAEWLVT